MRDDSRKTQTTSHHDSADRAERWKVIDGRLSTSPKDDSLENARKAALEIASYESLSSDGSLPAKRCDVSTLLPISNIVKFLTMTSDQRERNVYNGALAPTGWRSYRQRRLHARCWLRAASCWLVCFAFYSTATFLLGLFVTIPNSQEGLLIVMTPETEAITPSDEYLLIRDSDILSIGQTDRHDGPGEGGRLLATDDFHALFRLLLLQSDPAAVVGEVDFDQPDESDIASLDLGTFDFRLPGLDPTEPAPFKPQEKIANNKPPAPVLRLDDDRRLPRDARRTLQIEKIVNQVANINVESAARKRFSVAQALDANGATLIARRMYQRVIDEYPNTRTAQHAAKRLIESNRIELN